MKQEYSDFIKTKNTRIPDLGFDIKKESIHDNLFEYQKDIVRWSVKKGRCAVFLDTGLGKTFVQLQFAQLTNQRTLIIAPLSVARQTVREAKKIDCPIKYCRSHNEIDGMITITNYEMIDSFDFSIFGTVILDESSILKSIGGVYKRKLIDKCKDIPYRMACTATPAPNDNTEIGNHAEFLGICSHAEMLAQFFVNANKEHTFIDEARTTYLKKGSNKAGTEWRIKHHAENAFYEWLASWAICFTDPHDVGYDYDYKLPKLTITKHIIPMDAEQTYNGELFFTGLHGIADRSNVKRDTIDKKIDTLRSIQFDGQCIVWCNMSDEASAIRKAIECTEVKGDDTPEYKAQCFEDFQDKKFSTLLTKPKIGGFGLNFQNANTMIFFGLNDSWESFYQCIRREWRYGQKKPVTVHIILTEYEIEIMQNIERKDAQAIRLKRGLIDHVRRYEMAKLKNKVVEEVKYVERKEVSGKKYKLINGDSCVELGTIAENSVDLSVYSPPFVSLYTYTDSMQDLGNCTNDDTFYKHYSFIVKELLRVTKPGRLSCVHVSDIPAMACRDGYIGVKDFPGDVIRMHMAAGWTFYGRAFVQKNPQAQAIRTKAKGLLFVQLRKDSSDSRPALVDQVLIFKKDGENAVPVRPVENGEIDNETWIEWAHGMWIGINESDTLQFYDGRDTNDEKHICPLQLGTIERCIKLYSNPNETVLTPFLGIGSEAFQAIKFGRRAIGIELKESYFKTACKNVESAECQFGRDLFSEVSDA